MAQTEGTASAGTGSITINNAAKGETYSVVKLFDATVGSEGAISYTGNIPESLKEYFTKDSAGNISRAAGKTDDDIIAAVQAWAKDQTATSTAESDGSALTFAGLAYGYYAIKSSQGATITIDSTNPDAEVYDKNSKTITVKKTVDKESYSIGDTITYTASFDTVNWLGEAPNSKIVTKYVISDTLPEFLSDVKVTGITVDGTAIATQQFDSEKKITIPWVTGTAPDYTSLYKNGAKLVITYTAKLTSVTNINTADTNTVTIQPYVYDTTEKPWEEKWQDDSEIKTYAAALKKTDGTNPLPGAQFTIKGLTVSGSAGEYTVVSYNPADNAPESTVLDTDANGKLYILGLASDVKLTVTEYKAPDGYNKLTQPVEVIPQLLTTKIYKASGSIKYDAKGNVIESSATATTTETVSKNLTDLDASAVEVVNNKGTELPSTGGMGTTWLYIIGVILLAGAGILLVTRRRMKAE